MEIDFTPPFVRMCMIPTLEQALAVKLPPADQFDTPEVNTLLSQLCEKHEVHIFVIECLTITRKVKKTSCI